MREALGHYRTLVISGEYTFDSPGTAAITTETFIPALKYCIDIHPALAVVYKDPRENAAEFARPVSIDLRNHVSVLDLSIAKQKPDDNENLTLKRLISQLHDQPFENKDSVPPWKIVVLPLEASLQSRSRRVFIAFCLSHVTGDGRSSLAVHRTLIHGLNGGAAAYSADYSYATPQRPLAPTAVEAGSIYISWGFLLAPLGGLLLPPVIAKYFNLRAASAPEPPDMWRPSPMSYDEEQHHTGLEILSIDRTTLNKLLTACRSHSTKLTGVLNQLILRALSKQVPATAPAGTFVAQYAVDLRPLLPMISNNDMSVCASGVYEVLPRIDTNEKIDERFWEGARTSTSKLAEGLITLTDQPIGLLKYIGSLMRPWLQGKIGKPRDASYEISNLTAFDPDAASDNMEEKKREQEHAGKSATNEKTWDIKRMYFSQPAHATAAALVFNVVSRKGGDLVICPSWQMGSLMPGRSTEEEGEFVKVICGSIEEGIRDIVSSTETPKH